MSEYYGKYAESIRRSQREAYHYRISVIDTPAKQKAKEERAKYLWQKKE